MKIEDIAWSIIPLINIDGYVEGFQITGTFHEFSRSSVVQSDVLEQAMKRIAYEIGFMHSRARGHL